MLILNPLKNLQKTHAKKLLAKQLQKMEFFNFYYYMQKFSVYNFFGVNFFAFQRIRTQYRILCLLITISKQQGGSILSNKSKSLYPVIYTP